MPLRYDGNNYAYAWEWSDTFVVSLPPLDAFDLFWTQSNPPSGSGFQEVWDWTIFIEPLQFARK